MKNMLFYQIFQPILFMTIIFKDEDVLGYHLSGIWKTYFSDLVIPVIITLIFKMTRKEKISFIQ